MTPLAKLTCRVVSADDQRRRRAARIIRRQLERESIELGYRELGGEA